MGNELQFDINMFKYTLNSHGHLEHAELLTGYNLTTIKAKSLKFYMALVMLDASDNRYLAPITEITELDNFGVYISFIDETGFKKSMILDENMLVNAALLNFGSI